MIFVRRSGLTVIELLVSISILVLLFTATTVVLNGVERKASSVSGINRLISDIKEQQLKAMVSDAGSGTVASSSGVYFNKTDYVLFRGNSFNAQDSTNYTTTLDEGLEFSDINLPNSQIRFQVQTGQVENYVAGQDNFSLLDTSTGTKKKLTINQMGVVLSVN